LKIIKNENVGWAMQLGWGGMGWPA